jgi:hypothetical protein
MGLETQITTKLNHNISFVPSFSFPRCLLSISCVCYCYNCVYHCDKIIFKLHALNIEFQHFLPKFNKGCATLWPCHLHFKSILRQNKNYGNSNISPCQNIIFKKSSKRNQKPSRYYNSEN